MFKIIINNNNPRCRVQPPPLRAPPLPGAGGSLPPHQRHHPPQADPQTQAVVPRQPGPQCAPGYMSNVIYPNELELETRDHPKVRNQGEGPY